MNLSDTVRAALRWVRFRRHGRISDADALRRAFSALRIEGERKKRAETVRAARASMQRASRRAQLEPGIQARRRKRKARKRRRT